MESFSALLALCEGNSPVIGEFPSQRPVTRSFDVFFDLHPNKRLTKQLRRRWFETPSRSLWRHYNVSRKCICNLHDVCRVYSFEYTSCLLSHTVWVTWCFQFVSAVGWGTSATVATLPFTARQFVLNIRYLGQKKYRWGEMYRMTILWRWPKVMAVSLIKQKLLLCTI